MGAYWKEQLCLGSSKEAKESIFPFSVDIMQNTNFFKAFTASASVPTIYIQQFWNTLTYEAKTGAYSFQLDETRFVLDANLLREALEITPIDQAHQFVSPPSGDAIMDFVNELGYTEEIHFVSRMAVNNLYQPWRAILSMINQCLTGKTSGYDRPRYPVLQMLWGIITSTNVDYAELMWEEFVQAIQTFLTDKANLGSPTKKGRKDKPHVIPYCRFTKLIICHLGRKHNLHQRSESPLHLAEEDLRLGNLKFVPKGEDDEPKRENKETSTAKQLKPKPIKEKSSKPAPALKPKVTQVKSAKPSPAKHLKMGKVQKIRNGKTIEEASTRPSAQPRDNTSANIVHDCPSPADAETGVDTDKTNGRGDTEILQIGEEQGEDVDNQANLEEKTAKLNQGQAGSNTGKTLESQPPPETLSSMKNLDDAYTIGDQFLNDKSTEDEPRKLNVEAEVVFMVTVPIYQVVFTLELRDLPHKINQTVNEVVKEAVHVALQALLRDRFRELPKANMKEILYWRMFESGTYKLLPEHVALYEALEASMERTNRDEFFAEKDKSRKRYRDDQDPPLPPPDSDLKAPSSYSRQKSAPHSEQPVEDVPIPNDVNILGSEDTDTAHLPKKKTRPDWLKPVPEEDRPTTPEPDCVIPPNKLPKTENNWAKALASSYQDPDEYKLLR
ncbi:hypothetical protein Tco_0548094 [Tanacetum coccineum]